MFTITELSERSGIHHKTLRRWIQNGILDARKSGDVWIITTEAGQLVLTLSAKMDSTRAVSSVLRTLAHDPVLRRLREDVA